MEPSIFQTTVSCFLLIIISGSIFIWFRRANTNGNLQEPPYIAPKLPIFGHVIGFTQRRFDYYYDLFKASHHDIYSLTFPGMPGGRAYIINSPELLPHILRNPSKLSLTHVDAIYTSKLANLSPSATKILSEYIHVGDAQPTYLKEGLDNVYSKMKPGDALTRVTETAVDMLAASVGELERKGENHVELNGWVRNEILCSITQSVFGPKNPYQDPEIARTFWEFEKNVPGVMFLPLPQYTCAKSYSARQKVIHAFVAFYKRKGNDTASSWVQGATAISQRYEIADFDKAGMDIANSHGIIANTTPTAFWTLYHIFSDHELLCDVRSAVLPLLTTTKSNDEVSYTLDVGKIRDVPLLKSILYEVLRCYANGVGTRFVVEDTIIADRYLLKKGCFLFR